MNNSKKDSCLIKIPKKLIEVALPLDDINIASAREKSIRHGHPSTLHLWWARRPLAAARAVIFSQMVNDPGYERSIGRGVNKEKAAQERERLFNIIRRLVQWENTNNEEVLQEAREEIRKSWRETCALNKDHPQAAELFNPEKLPAFHDPFAGGGALPLEAQRLGLEAYASDLNPVAVLICKAMIEIPPKFAGRPPVHPVSAEEGKPIAMKGLGEEWKGASGLADDVRYYGQWMREEAEKRIGHLYPKVKIAKEMVKDRPDLKRYLNQELTVIAWIWARTVKSPNPAFSHVDVPLASTFMLSTKEGKEAYIDPAVEGSKYHFVIKTGKPKNRDQVGKGTKLARGANFQCLLSGTPITSDYIKAEGRAGRMGTKLMAIVIEGERGRVYVNPSEQMEGIARQALPSWKPDLRLPDDPRNFWTVQYGLTMFSDLFTPRQLVALTTFSDLVLEAREQVKRDAVAAGLPDDDIPLDASGAGAQAYADAVSVYLAFALDKQADLGNSLCRWEPIAQCPRQLYARQAIPMVWDFAEGNPLGSSSGSWIVFIDGISDAFENAFDATSHGPVGNSSQADAASQTISLKKIISTDPPYYDNIGYADLSDFFYIWQRRTLRTLFPKVFPTLAVPKAEELVATPYRHGSKEAAEDFFLSGMTQALHGININAHPAFPATIYYAFKQSESEKGSEESDLPSDNVSSSGWETFLHALISAGFELVGTWPMRTENSSRMVGQGTNALASSVVLVCRKRSNEASAISRREFIRELNTSLPGALIDMTQGGEHSPVAPVDLSQAIIGPGMAIFSKYSSVLEADGTPMSVRTALQLINRFVAEEDFDADTQFCLAWFETNGWAEGKFGEGDVLARAKGTSVEGIAEAGVAETGRGKLRLLRWVEFPGDWSPAKDQRTPVWEALHQMIRALNKEGEQAAGVLLAQMPERAESIRALAYRLYTLCERKNWAEDARAYNELVTAWPGMEAAARDAGVARTQISMDMGDKPG
jgi:putative DNA methylase